MQADGSITGEIFHWTPYSGDLAIELYREEVGNGFFVRIVYCEETLFLPHLQPDENGMCRLESFQKHLEPLLVKTKEEYETLRECADEKAGKKRKTE